MSLNSEMDLNFSYLKLGWGYTLVRVEFNLAIPFSELVEAAGLKFEHCWTEPDLAFSVH